MRSLNMSLLMTATLLEIQSALPNTGSGLLTTFAT